MEGGDNILDDILEDDNLNDDDDDVEMVDIEEGELVESVAAQNGVGGGDADEAMKKSSDENKSNLRRAKKKKTKNKKRKRQGFGAAGFNIDRFVIDTCRHLKEKKSYMVYTAIGCLGVIALTELVKEVDAIQACGGQETADGKRLRTGGGVLWGIIKHREPQAYKEIMKKASEFEKQFRQPNLKKQHPLQKKEESSEGTAITVAGEHQGNASDNNLLASSEMKDQLEPPCSEEKEKDKRIPVHERLRIPVSYDDELLGLNADNDAA
ncbi:uncharacterized protein LOC130935026 [Arachis stenosperma]|uniref:uncharacterized protein LOC130935026 n=1 Tax=Arachis stenosperma TaxID=217475 RepID=UPI0025AD8DF2|nr:uncharacterized protein LOC130935026 [Arachis stenosperma]XP_057720550.1 uncharacterized protein LOC130935026 [Arachis stenosperma]XP_057720551.1 uncharacterized protein LOC130935026 [Arachis stenosperma]